MDLQLDAVRAGTYESGRQRARVLTEPWIVSHAYCPNCGNSPLVGYPNNSPVGDFYCAICKENYELKSKQAKFGEKVDDGAYRAMLRRVSGNANPSLFLLNYSVIDLTVTNLTIVPKHFISTDMIEERKPLPATARRAGWVGCRILLRSVPHAGRIAIIRNGIVEPKTHVLAEWKHTMFLRGQRDPQARGWLLRVMRCIEHLGKRQFSLDEIYAFENELSAAYPSNRNIRPKIRQKLQVLRDNGYLEFVDRGTYRLV